MGLRGIEWEARGLLECGVDVEARHGGIAAGHGAGEGGRESVVAARRLTKPEGETRANHGLLTLHVAGLPCYRRIQRAFNIRPRDRAESNRAAGGYNYEAQPGSPTGVGPCGDAAMAGGGAVWRYAGYARLARDVAGARHVARDAGSVLRRAAGAAGGVPTAFEHPGRSRQARPGVAGGRPEEGAPRGAMQAFQGFPCGPVQDAQGPARA